MSARFLLIDGYNLMHAAGMGRLNYGPGDLQRCRERLLRFLLSRLTPAEVARATIVFDARDPPPGAQSRQVFSGLKVAFANPGGDADAFIQELIEEHSAPKRVLLVSSDHQLQRVARRRRAEFVDSETFFELQERRRPRVGRASGVEPDPKFEGLTSHEAQTWQTLFGEVPIRQLTEAENKPQAAGPASEGTNSPPDGNLVERQAETTSRKGRRPRKRQRPELPQNRTEKLSQPEVEYWLGEFRNIAGAIDSGETDKMSLNELEAWFEDFKRQERKSGR